jgi:quercetin dioxygenase-like cupin family protein
MGKQGIVVPPGQGLVANYTPGRSIVLKLRCGETDGSIMLFEATAPVGAKSTLHLHRDSDEVAYVLNGQITFLIGEDITVGGPGTSAFMPRGVRHAWKSTGVDPGRVLFLYTPAEAGGLIEEQQQSGSNFSSMTETERAAMLQRYGWELLGPSPL